MNNDKLFQQALQRQNDRAAKMKMPDDMEQRVMQRIHQQDSKPSRRHVWFYPTITAAAACALLLMMIHFGNTPTSEDPRLVAQADTIVTSPQTKEMKTEEQPQQKVKNTEAVDSIKIIKERYRMPRPPKHYMAKAKTEEIIPEPEIIDEVELAERAIAEERRQMEMEIMAQMSGSLQADFMEITKEIRSRGERLVQEMEIAMSEED